jgi:hypothetical protein
METGLDFKLHGEGVGALHPLSSLSQTQNFDRFDFSLAEAASMERQQPLSLPGSFR